MYIRMDKERNRWKKSKNQEKNIIKLDIETIILASFDSSPLK